MAEEAIRCPHCHSKGVVKYGRASKGKARYRCQQADECGRTFMRAYARILDAPRKCSGKLWR